MSSTNWLCLLLHFDSGLPGLAQKKNLVSLTTFPSKLHLYTTLVAGQSLTLAHSPANRVVVVKYVVVVDELVG